MESEEIVIGDYDRRKFVLVNTDIIVLGLETKPVKALVSVNYFPDVAEFIESESGVSFELGEHKPLLNVNFRVVMVEPIYYNDICPFTTKHDQTVCTFNCDGAMCKYNKTLNHKSYCDKGRMTYERGKGKNIDK